MASLIKSSNVMIQNDLSDTDLDRIYKKWKTFTIAEEAYNYITKTCYCNQENSACQCIPSTRIEPSTKANLKKINIGSIAYKKTKQVLSYVIRNSLNYKITEDGLIQNNYLIEYCFIYKVQPIPFSDAFLLYVVLPSDFRHKCVENSIACLRQLQSTHEDNDPHDINQLSFHCIVGFTEAFFKAKVNNKDCVVCALSVSSKHPLYLANSFIYSYKKTKVQQKQWPLNVPYSIQWIIPQSQSIVKTLRLLLKEFSSKSQENNSNLSLLYNILYLIRPVTMSWGIPCDTTLATRTKETMYLYDESHLNEIRQKFHSLVNGKEIPESCIIAGAPGSGKTCLMMARLLDILKNSVCVRVIVRNAYQAYQFVSTWKTYIKTSHTADHVFVSPFTECCDHKKNSLWDDFCKLNQILSCFEICFTKDISLHDDVWKTTLELDQSDTAHDTHTTLDSRVRNLKKHFDSRLEVLFSYCTGIAYDKTISESFFHKWMKGYEDVTWSLNLPNNGTFRAEKHSSLILIWLAGMHVSQDLSLYLNTSNVISDDCNNIEKCASFSTVCLREWPKSLLIGIKALKYLLTFVKENSKSPLLAMDYSNHRFLVIPVCDTSQDTLPLLIESLQEATHVFIDDAEHIPFLILFLILIWIDKIQLKRKQLYVKRQPKLHLCMLTALSTALQAAKKLNPFQKNWYIYYLPLCYTLSPSYLSLIKSTHKLLGASCVASDQIRKAIPISVDYQNIHFKNSQDIYLITTACIVPPFAIRRRNFKGTIFIEGVIAEALISNFEKQLHPNEDLEVFVMSLCDNEIQLIIPLMKKSYKRITVEFGTPESFLGRRCDITIILCLCTGAVSCGSVLNEIHNVSFLDDTSTHLSCATDSLTCYDCPYNLRESDHRMRLALTRSRYSTYIIGQIPSLFERHYQYHFFNDIVQLIDPFTCLMCLVSPDNLKKCIQMFLSANLLLAFKFASKQISFKCVGSILQRSLQIKPISMLNQLTSAFGMPSRFKETIELIQKERCIMTQVVYESVQYINTNLNCVSLSPTNKKQFSNLMKQCIILNKLLLNNLDWNLSLIFFLSSQNLEQIMQALNRTKTKTFIHFIPFSISKKFQYIDIFNYPEIFPYFHFLNKNFQDNNTDSVTVTSQKIVLIFHCTRSNLIQGGLQILNELCLLASLMEEKRRIFLVNCFIDMQPWNQIIGLTQRHVLNYQISSSLLLLALSTKTDNKILLVNFEETISMELQKFLFMLGLVNADESLLDSSDIYLLCNKFMGSKLLFNIQKYGKRSLEQSEHFIMVQENECFGEKKDEHMYEKKSSGKQKAKLSVFNKIGEGFQSRKNKKILKNLMQLDNTGGETVIAKCFPSYQNVYGRLLTNSQKHFESMISLTDFINMNNNGLPKMQSHDFVSHNIASLQKMSKSQTPSNSNEFNFDNISKMSRSCAESKKQSADCLSILTSDSNNSILNFLKSARSDKGMEECEEKCVEEGTVQKENYTPLEPEINIQTPTPPIHMKRFLPKWRLRALRGKHVDLDAFAQRETLQKLIKTKEMKSNGLQSTITTPRKIVDEASLNR